MRYMSLNKTNSFMRVDKHNPVAAAENGFILKFWRESLEWIQAS